MKKILLFLFVLSSIAISAQTTFDISWVLNVGPADLTIDQGDTVRWTWGDGIPHSVTSLPGSTESFDSGIQTGMGFEFSYTFTQVGDNDYQCDVHPANMFGTITVEEILSVDDKFALNLNVYPNPASDLLNVTSLFQLDGYSIYSVSGQLVSKGDLSGNVETLDVASLLPGVYFVRLISGDLSHTTKIVITK